MEVVLTLPEQNWASVVTFISPWLAEKNLKPILQRTLALQNPLERAHALAVLVPNLTGENCNQAIIEALKAAIKLPWFAGDSVVFRIAPMVTAPLLQPILEVMDSCQDPLERAIVLAMLFPYIPDHALLLKRIRQEMLEALSSFQKKLRLDMLQGYLVRTIFTIPLLSSETIGSVTSHMLEICRDWHWL